jgi:hypothetical protein
MLTVNGVSGWTLPPLGGNSNLTEGMLSTLGISPIGVGLHEPPWTCRPFVMVLPTQKPMKLFLEQC